MEKKTTSKGITTKYYVKTLTESWIWRWVPRDKRALR